MKKGWSIVITIVLVAILLGAVSVGVGYVTGGSWDRIYSVLDARYNITAASQAYGQYLQEVWNVVVDAWNAV